MRETFPILEMQSAEEERRRGAKKKTSGCAGRGISGWIAASFAVRLLLMNRGVLGGEGQSGEANGERGKRPAAPDVEE